MWTYEQATGRILDPEGALFATGYAGHGAGKNDPALQGVVDIGPLPAGTYTLGVPRDSAQLGPYAIPLIADPSNAMFGRSGFYLHGVSASHPGAASCGCIVLSPEGLRAAIYDSGDHVVRVIAGP